MTSKRQREQLAGARQWMRDQFREGDSGISPDREQVKARLLKQVEEAIDEKLDRLSEGEALGVLFRVEIIHEDRTFEGERGRRESEIGQQWRRAVFARDRYRCGHCGAGDDIQAHHILPWATHPESRFDLANGVTLCLDCHEKEHPGMPLLRLRRPRKH